MHIPLYPRPLGDKNGLSTGGHNNTCELRTSRTKTIFKSVVVFIGKRREGESDRLKAPSQKKT